MTFADYFEVITNSVCETGYEAFLPSLCTVDGDDVIMRVLGEELANDGDEQLAMCWAESFVREGRTVFLAYRRGQRTVTVLEIRGYDAVRKRDIRVDPFRSQLDASPTNA